MSELLPWLHRKKTRIVNLKTIDKRTVPEAPGLYIMLSANTEYIYPRGKSRCFYIGQSVNLRDRIWTHRKYCNEAKDKPPHDYWWPRYEYASSYGCKITWITCVDAQSAKDLEHELLVDFAKYYGAKPVANDQGAW